ncbi:hypothetical protein AVEN_271467-1 [Araneus ventricosus]|uniref:Uncharacterized protein n=1 Tax=Araneus ventricosus TaxID=182803 RepID=A0A4Y2KN63_ARAVE|nr:hypothetical protein AVEN_271467-1 [Araneus ventricosus]
MYLLETESACNTSVPVNTTEIEVAPLEKISIPQPSLSLHYWSYWQTTICRLRKLDLRKYQSSTTVLTPMNACGSERNVRSTFVFRQGAGNP